MPSAIQEFFLAFKSGKGNQIMVATLLGRGINFLVNLCVIRLLTEADYGNLSYAFTIIAFILPFLGGGILPGLVRFGAALNGQLEKKYFLRFTLFWGMIVSFGLLILTWLFIPLLTQKLPGSSLYLSIFAFQLVGLLWFKSITSYCMIVRRNDWFAKLEITLSILFLIFNITGAYLFGGKGYVISLVGLPFFVAAYCWWRLNLSDKKPGLTFNFDIKALFNFGFFTSRGTVLAQMLYAVDILLIGNMLANPEAVAQYRVASMIPLNLIILGLAVMTTFLVPISRNADLNPRFLIDFYKSYLKIFIPICIGILVVFYFGGGLIIQLFGEKYQGQESLMMIFTVGVVGGLLLRVPMGNILPTIGYPRMNAFLAFIILLLNLGGSWWMLPRYGLTGAAVVTSALFWLSGIFSFAVFWWWRKQQQIDL